MIRQRLFWLCVVFVGVFARSASAGEIVLDNITGFMSTTFFSSVGYDGPNNAIVNGSELQRFDMSVSGQLEAITTIIGRRLIDEIVPLNITVLEYSGTLPGTTLGELVIPASAIAATETETTFDFSSEGIFLEAGRTYVVAYWVDTPDEFYRYSFPNIWAGNNALGYPPITGRDRLVGTFIPPPPENIIPWDELGEIPLRVQIVPEPAAVGMAALGLAMLLRRRSRS